MVVKENQVGVWSAIDRLFREPATRVGETDLHTIERYSKGHERVERRRPDSRLALNSYLDRPDASQVLRRTSDSVETSTGLVRHKVTDGISGSGGTQALPEQMAWLRRQHWTIEKRGHFVRDDRMREDRRQVSVSDERCGGSTAQRRSPTTGGAAYWCYRNR